MDSDYDYGHHDYLDHLRANGEMTVPSRRTTVCGLDTETLERMEKFYDGVYREEVDACLEAMIQYRAEPSYRNYLTVRNKLSTAREHMIRRDVFNTHNK